MFDQRVDQRAVWFDPEKVRFNVIVHVGRENEFPFFHHYRAQSRVLTRIRNAEQYFRVTVVTVRTPRISKIEIQYEVFLSVGLVWT